MEPEIPKIKYSCVCKIPSTSKYRSYKFNVLGRQIIINMERVEIILA